MTTFKKHLRRSENAREARLPLVSELILRGYTVRQIRTEVTARLGLATYSLSTAERDCQYLYNEWQKRRQDNIEQDRSLELARIDATIVELWGQWELSKQTFTKQVDRMKGLPNDDLDAADKTIITALSSSKEVVRGLGDVSYITEIRQQLIERRKLLGLYDTRQDLHVTHDLSALTDEERRHLADIGQKLFAGGRVEE